MLVCLRGTLHLHCGVLGRVCVHHYDLKVGVTLPSASCPPGLGVYNLLPSDKQSDGRIPGPGINAMRRDLCCVLQVLLCSSFPCYKNEYCIIYRNALFWPVLAEYTEAKFGTDLILAFSQTKSVPQRDPGHIASPKHFMVHCIGSIIHCVCPNRLSRVVSEPDRARMARLHVLLPALMLVLVVMLMHTSGADGARVGRQLAQKTDPKEPKEPKDAMKESGFFARLKMAEGSEEDGADADGGEDDRRRARKLAGATAVQKPEPKEPKEPSDASAKDESAQFARVELFAASTAAAGGDAVQEQTDGAAEDGTADEGEGDEDDGSDGDRRRR